MRCGTAASCAPGSTVHVTYQVNGRGTTEVQFNVPNALSGQDDVIPLNPGDPYLIEITSLTH